MSTVVSIRRNGATNPEAQVAATGFGAYATGTSETGTTTFISGAADGPREDITSYARRTVTVAKTAGSNGWQATSASYRDFTPGVAGTPVTVSVWFRSSSTINVTMRTILYNAGGGTVTTGDSTLYTLNAGVWTRLSATVVASGDFASVGWWAYHLAAYILPVAATLDATATLSEVGASTAGNYFSGNSFTVAAPTYSPAGSYACSWEGAVGASASLETLTIPLQDYQIELPDDTVTGARTSVGLLEVNGLRGTSEVRDADYERAGTDGTSPGMSFLGSRKVEIKWLVTAPGALESALQILNRNWQNTNDPSSLVMTARDYLMQVAVSGSRFVSALQIQLPGRPLPFLLFGKPGRLNPPVDSQYQVGWLEVSSEWIVPDGKLYDTTINTASTTLPTSNGGASFPWSFPVNFGPSTGGTLVVANDGLYPAKPVFRINGPVNNPKIANSAGQYIRVNLNVAAGDTVLVDSDSRVVRLNGANRNNALDVGSSFFTIPPGGTALSFSSTDGGDVSGSVSVYTLNTYSAA